MKKFDPKNILSDSPPNKIFKFRHGLFARNLYELLHQIENTEEHILTADSGSYFKDFANWISDVLRDKKLARQLRKVHTKAVCVSKIKRRIKQLERKIILPDIIPTELQPQDNMLAIGAFLTLMVLMLSLFLYSQSAYQNEIIQVNSQIAQLRERDLVIQRTLLLSISRQQNQSKSSEPPTYFDSFFSYKEKFAPQDFIKEEQIMVYDDKIVIDVSNVTWAGFESTGSMTPTLSEDANALEIEPLSPEEIKKGDIISYETSDGIIIHRVVEIGEDEQGWYALTKGDNNKLNDPYKVRFSQVQRLLIGILY